MTDRNEALRLIEIASGYTGLTVDEANQAAALLRQQAERIAELEAEVLEQARLNGMGAERELALMAERDQLRAEVERLRVDAERLDWLESEADDLRTVATGEDDYDWVVISHHMAKPHEREVGRASTARAAIDHARTTHKDEG